MTRGGRLGCGHDAERSRSQSGRHLFGIAPGGGPRTTSALTTLREALVARFSWDQALKYVDDTNNRFLNKARGLITFNGLTMSALSILLRSTPAPKETELFVLSAGVVCAIISAGILLWFHFLAEFGALNDFANAQTEFPPYFTQVIIKGKWIAVSGFVSLISVVPVIWTTIKHASR